MTPEIMIAALAAAAVLLITVGVAARPGKDAVQTRLEQLVVQPKTLEEFELQQPFYRARAAAHDQAPGTHGPPQRRRGRHGRPHRCQARKGRLSRRAARCRLDWREAAGRHRRCHRALRHHAGPHPAIPRCSPVRHPGGGRWVHRARILAGTAGHRALVCHGAPAAGRAGPADDLRGGRPGLRRRAGQGGREDGGAPGHRVPPGPGGDPHGPHPPRGAARRGQAGGRPAHQQLHWRHRPGGAAWRPHRQGAPDPVPAAAHRAPPAG